MSGSIWWVRRTLGSGSGGRVLGVMVRASTWYEARARASVELGKRYGHDLCAPELLEVTS